MPIIKILVCKNIDDLKNKIFSLTCLSIFLIVCSYTSSFASHFSNLRLLNSGSTKLNPHYNYDLTITKLAADLHQQESVAVQEIYELLQQIEKTKIKAILEQPLKNDVQVYISKLNKLKRKILIASPEPTDLDKAITELKLGKQNRSFDFTSYTFGQVIASLVEIQKNKVCLQNTYKPEQQHEHYWAGEYSVGCYTEYHRTNGRKIDVSSDDEPYEDYNHYWHCSEKSVDPLYIRIQIANAHIFNLAFNGIFAVNQPLNGLIRRSGYKPMLYPITKNPANEWEKNQLDEFLQDKTTETILLAFEVARRKQEQGEQDKYCERGDIYYDLPVLCAASMALYLIEQGYLPEEEFWAKDGKYHTFSADTKEKRELAIKEIIKLFLRKSHEEGARFDAFENIISDLIDSVINKLLQE